MNVFFTYAKERFPLPVYLLLTLGFGLSSHLFAAGIEAPINWTIVTAVTFAHLLFFFELRLMDERKDVEKDRTVNPDRPLARGFVTKEQANRWILTITGLMLAYALFLGVAFQPQAGICYAITTVYLWLMFKEFFVGEKLSEYPFIYAITHQAILVPVALLGIAATTIGGIEWSREPLWLAALMTSSFFAYEICRKLDPRSHRLNRTYLQYHGPVKTMCVVALLNAVSVYAGIRLGLEKICIPFQTLLFLSLLVPILKPERFKLTEISATLGLLVHLWAYVILKGIS